MPEATDIELAETPFWMRNLGLYARFMNAELARVEDLKASRPFLGQTRRIERQKTSHSFSSSDANFTFETLRAVMESIRSTSI